MQARRPNPQTGDPATCATPTVMGGPVRTRALLLATVMWTTMALAPMAFRASAQYTAPGATTPGGDLVSKEELEEKYTEARWSLGSLRVAPWFGIHDASFVDNISSRSDAAMTDDDGDFTITAGAGLRGYLKTGSRLYLSGHALPEYVWWQDREDKRSLNGRYGLGLFGYFNRLTLEASNRRLQQQNFFSPEIQELTTTLEDISRLAVALRVANKVELFATGERVELTSQEDEDAIFSLLDRTEETVTVGVRYSRAGGFWVELAYEDRTNTFAESARNLSDSGEGERLGIGFQGDRGDIRLSLTSLTLEPVEGSVFSGSDELTGSLDLLWNASPRADLLAYLRRRQSFAVNAETSHFLGERLGVRVDFQVRLGTLGVYAEVGDDTFDALAAESFDRIDDVSAVGALLSFNIGRRLELIFQVTRTEYDSNFDFFDREVTNGGFTVDLGGLVEPLKLGSNPGVW